MQSFKDSKFFPNTIIYWNLLPQIIVLCPTVNTFRGYQDISVLNICDISVLGTE